MQRDEIATKDGEPRARYRGLGNKHLLENVKWRLVLPGAFPGDGLRLDPVPQYRPHSSTIAAPASAA